MRYIWNSLFRLIDDEWRKTWRGHEYLTLQDNNWGIAVFTTSKMLTAMQKSTCFYLDGTFRTAPLPYMQLLTIHCRYQGFVVPVAFCLLTGKTIGQYNRQVLQHLKRTVRRRTGHRLHPSEAVLDFEYSLMLAIQTEFPTCRLSGCYFHFQQSLWRHLQHLGLSRDYRRNRKLQKVVRLVMSIGFLPVIVVRQNFRVLHGSRRMRQLVLRFPELDDWLDYVHATYIAPNALFPTATWKVYERSLDTRTDNHLEGK